VESLLASKWLNNIEACLGKIAGILTDQEGDPIVAFHYVTEVACELFRAPRAGIWGLAQDQSGLVSYDLYDSLTHTHHNDFRLQSAEVKELISDLRQNPRAIVREAGEEMTHLVNDRSLQLPRAGSGIIAASNAPFAQICFFTASRIAPDPRWNESEISLAKAIANCLPILFHAQARKRSEIELKKNLSLLTGTLESTDEGIVVTDLNRRVTLANHRFMEMIGRSTEDAAKILGSTIRENLLHLSKDPKRVAAEAGLLYSNPELQGIHRVEYKDGRVLERYSRPQRIEGKIVGRIFSYRDITSQVRSEQTRARLEKELRQTQKLEAIGTLAGGIAHDFNNILSGITCNLALARCDLTPEHPAIESLDEITHATRRAASLVKQILTFSQQETPQRTSISIGDVMKEALGFMRATLPKTVTLEVEQRIPLPTVFANSTQLHQVFINLCTNAWHAIGKNPGTIRVAAQAVSITHATTITSATLQAGDYLKISVADTGCGMDAKTLEHIFEPFFTTKEPRRGTGLGLSVVHGIVHGYGGAINVTSTPAHGTRFDLYFPAHTGSITPQREPADFRPFDQD
jgi:PAS domain S-box-containing protein